MKEILENSLYIRKPKKSRVKGFSARTQLDWIIRKYPDATVIRSKGASFTIVLKLRPTPISKEYDIKISYEKTVGVKVYVINEKLELAHNRSKLPHVYSHKEQRLCLYSPSGNEWSEDKLIFSTIIPWASDWLFYYELWLIDGEWLGGGHDEYR